MSEPTPLLDIAGNDRVVSEQLRRSLTILASRASEPAARTSIVECLSGQASVRELTSNDSFTAVLDRLLPRPLEKFNALSDEQIARMAAAAEADLSSPTDRPDSLRPHPTSDLPPIDDEWPGSKGILSSEWCPSEGQRRSTRTTHIDGTRQPLVTVQEATLRLGQE